MGHLPGQFFVANKKSGVPLSFRVSPETLLIEKLPILPDNEEHRLPEGPLFGPDAAIRQRLIAIGEGIDWPLWDKASNERLKPLLDAAASTPVFARGIGQSSMLPEAALLVANQLGSHMSPDAKVLVRPDLDLLALQLALEDHQVTFWEENSMQPAPISACTSACPPNGIAGIM